MLCKVLFKFYSGNLRKSFINAEFFYPFLFNKFVFIDSGTGNWNLGCNEAIPWPTKPSESPEVRFA